MERPARRLRRSGKEIAPARRLISQPRPGRTTPDYAITPTSQISGELADAVISVLSRDRLKTYFGASPTTTSDRDALHLYAWNIELSAAFWAEFNILEVALRNACDRRLREMSGNVRWWSGDLPFHRSTTALLQEAIERASRLHTSHQPGHVVAELSFGFWAGLVAARYHRSLWVGGLDLAIPGAGGQRKVVHQHLERLRKLRN